MTIVTIARREMAERKLILVGAAWAALLAAAWPWLRHLAGMDAGSTRVAALALTCSFSWVFAAFSGATMIPADLAQGRIGFYLTRPVSAGSILVGRFLGAWLLVLGSGLVVALGHVLFHPADLIQMAEWVGCVALSAIPVLFLFHLIGITWAARTWWVLVELAAVAGFGWTMATLVGSLLRAGCMKALPWLLIGVAGLVAVVLIGACFLQMEWGRADLRKGLRVQAVALATGLLGVVAVAALFALWLRGGGPATLDGFHVQAVAPKGDWISVSGYGRMHQQSFLLNARTGESVAAEPWGKFSGDGQHWASLRLMLGTGQFCVETADLNASPARTKILGSYLRPTEWSSPLIAAVSPEGARAVLCFGREWWVIDLQVGRILEKETTPGAASNSRFCYFPGAVLREFRPLDEGAIAIREQDPATGQWRNTGQLAVKGGVRVDPVQGWLMGFSGTEYLVGDARSGAILGHLRPGSGGAFAMAPQPCGTNRLAAIELVSGDARLRFLDGTGQELWSKPLPKAGQYWICPESGTGRILVEALACTGAGGATADRLLEADPGTGSIITRPAAAQLLTGYQRLDPVGALTSSLFLGRGGGLLLAGPGGQSRVVIKSARYVPSAFDH
jgi:hypothetical protein